MSSPILNIVVGYVCLLVAHLQLKQGQNRLYYFTLFWAIANFIAATALVLR